MRKINLTILMILVFISVSGAQSRDSIKLKQPFIDVQPKGLDLRKETDESQSNSYYVSIEQMPVPIGGTEGIQERIKYPIKAIQKKVEGKVYILTYVNEFGDVEKAEVIKGIGEGCDEAALTAVKETKFIPGMHNGKNVKVQISVPIIFKINKRKYWAA